MSNTNRQLFVALVALLCIVPASFAVQVEDKAKKKCEPKHPRNCAQQVPEGGSSLVYVLGAGVMCLGAMLVRSRAAKPLKS